MSDQKRKWIAPQIIKFEQLPETFGICSTGVSVTGAPGEKNCSRGNGAKTFCNRGNGFQP